MLFILTVNNNPRGKVIRMDNRFTAWDSDDGVSELVVLCEEMFEYGIRFENAVVDSGYDATGVRALKLTPISKRYSFTIGDWFFVYSPTDLWAVLGNDRYMHIKISGRRYSVNDEEQYYADFIGLPQRSSKNEPLYSDIYWNDSFGSSVYFDEKSTVYSKNIKSALKRKLLY